MIGAVALEERVARDEDVEGSAAAAGALRRGARRGLALLPVEEPHSERGRPRAQLAAPVLQKARGRHHERGLVHRSAFFETACGKVFLARDERGERARLLLFVSYRRPPADALLFPAPRARQVRHGLRGLPQTHLVREDRARNILLVQQQQEVDADHLVRLERPRARRLAGDFEDVVGGDERAPPIRIASRRRGTEARHAARHPAPARRGGAARSARTEPVPGPRGTARTPRIASRPRLRHPHPPEIGDRARSGRRPPRRRRW